MYFSQFCIFYHSFSYAFTYKPRQTTVRTEKHSAEFLVAYSVPCLIGPAFTVVNVNFKCKGSIKMVTNCVCVKL